MNILNDKNIARAVSNIKQRAERLLDDETVVNTYVEVGILDQIANTNNQIIYGRRGTGKTHLFRYLESELKKSAKNVVVYVDCRTLGSAAEYSDASAPMQRRSMSLFKDIIEEVGNRILNYIIEEAPPNSEESLNALESLWQSTVFKNEETSAKEITERTLDKASSNSGASLSVGVKDIALKMGSAESEAVDVERTAKFTIPGGEKILFPDLNRSLKKLGELSGINVFVMFDEWSALPIDLQPLLAEFLKRSFLPVSQTTIKIAALEYRSQFSKRDDGDNLIGFELGSDIASSLDLDDYYVYDRNPEAIIKNFAEILYRHVKAELDSNYLESVYKIENSTDFLSTLLTDRANFEELVRASEGVIRDMMNIFNFAFFDSLKRGRTKIDKKSIVESSRLWFERDKSQNLDDDLNEVLRRIVDEVIGKKKARSFLIARDLEKNDKIQRLFDARVIHLITRGYADKDNPGSRYNVFGLDYGTYVDLINTNKQPELNFVSTEERGEGEDIVVPFDDKRSIRRIILTDAILS